MGREIKRFEKVLRKKKHLKNGIHSDLSVELNEFKTVQKQIRNNIDVARQKILDF